MAGITSRSLVVNQGWVWHRVNFLFSGKLWHNVEIIVTEVWFTQISWGSKQEFGCCEQKLHAKLTEASLDGDCLQLIKVR